MYLKDRLNIDSSRIYSEEGYLTVPANIARTGIQDYSAYEMGVTNSDPNRIFKVLRPAEEVFKDESLNSFANKPVTLNHPPELVNAKNYNTYSVGFSGNTVKKDGDFVLTELRITDESAIKDVESGKIELSNGYVCDIEWSSGTTESGEKYDAIQRNIRGNHIAIVDRARAGPACKIADQQNNNFINTSKNMKITIDGVDYEVSDQAGQAIAKLQNQIIDQDATYKQKDKDLICKEKEIKSVTDSMQAKLDDALSKIPTTESLDQMVFCRISLIDSVRKISPDFNWNGKDEATIKREIVGDTYPNIQLDSVSDDYVAARFDILLESRESNPQSTLDAALIKNTMVDNQTTSLYDQARKAAIERHQNAWKGGTN